MPCEKCFGSGRVTIGSQDLPCLCSEGHKNMSANVKEGEIGNLTFESLVCFSLTTEGEKVYQDFFRRMESEIPTLESCPCGRTKVTLNQLLEIFTGIDCFEKGDISLGCQ